MRALIKTQSNSNMCRSINADRNIQIGGKIQAGKVKMNEALTRRENQSEVEVGKMENNIKIYIIMYGTPLFNIGTVNHYLGSQKDTEAAEQVLSGTCETQVNIDLHAQDILEIIKNVEENLRNGSISITIYSEYFKRYYNK